MKALPQSARTVAAEVVARVIRDSAFGAAALDKALAESAQLTEEDRALATELAYGVLRTEGALRLRLERLAPRGLPDDPVVSSHLLVAAYQILLLDRVPAYAAVDGAVTAIKAARGTKVAGFANAILRRLAASRERLTREAAVLETVPEWLQRSIERAVGSDDARAVIGATNDASHCVSVRAREGAPLPSFLAESPKGRASPCSRLVRRRGDLRRRAGYAEGSFVIQEEGAQVVALALGAKRGDRVLDACAGRGQKTGLLRERIGETAELWAVDLYPQKLSILEAEFRRLGLALPTTAAVDWTSGSGPVPEGFDRVLVDAPCTGIGTLRRRPEIVRRLAPDDPDRLSRLAESILRRAAGRAKRGGRVVFAVCSVLVEEAEGTVGRVRDILEPAPFDAPDLSHLVDRSATNFRLTPGKHGTDGFFIASFVRL